MWKAKLNQIDADKKEVIVEFYDGTNSFLETYIIESYFKTKDGFVNSIKEQVAELNKRDAALNDIVAKLTASIGEDIA